MAKLAYFLLLLVITPVEAKAKKNSTGQTRVGRELGSGQTFKSISRELPDADCRQSCDPQDENSCPHGCNCEQDGNTPDYFCESAEEPEYCSPCTFGATDVCPPGCGCYPIGWTFEYGCEPYKEPEEPEEE